MRLHTDGGLRLSLAELLSIPLRHLVSGLDETRGLKLADCGRQVLLSGYTEWVSESLPTLTVGWDCRFDSFCEEPRWVRCSLPRTNLVLVSEEQHDFPLAQCISALASRIDAMNWQEWTQACITNRYR
jgi:hypothetical protein